MIKRSKRLSFSKPKRAPSRISSVTIGTHVHRSASNSGGFRGKQNEARLQQPYFSDPKKSARAHRGIVDHMTPDTASGESEAEYARRVHKPHYTKVLQRNSRIKTIVLGVLILSAVLIAAGTVGVFTFMGSVTDKMNIADPETRAALTAPAENKASYLLLTGEFYETGKEYSGPDLIMLVRMDATQKKVSIVSIPSNLQVVFADGSVKRLADAQMGGGDAALIKSVEEFAGVKIAHFVKTNRESFARLVDVTGGVSVDVVEEVDDPIAGPHYIPVGQQTLNGEEALTFCRATNFVDSEKRRADNQCKVAIALGNNLLNTNAFNFIFTLDGVSGLIKTDYNINSLMSLVDSFRGISSDNIYSFGVPGETSVSERTGIEYFLSKDSEWTLIKEALQAGENPANAIKSPDPVDPASFTITVRNGSGVTGDAQRVADVLSAKGFQISETGNADQHVYNETLVVYQQSEKAAAAATVVDNLGIGRAIPSDTFYSFETDILVVVGKDWIPLN